MLHLDCHHWPTPEQARGRRDNRFVSHPVTSHAVVEDQLNIDAVNHIALRIRSGDEHRNPEGDEIFTALHELARLFQLPRRFVQHIGHVFQLSQIGSGISKKASGVLQVS